MEPPLQPPTHHVLLTCHRHPHVGFTGFCSSCLRERLQTLDSSSSSSILAGTHRNSTSTIPSSLKSIFSISKEQQQTDLRRCKSTSFEPRRKSRDVSNEIAPVEVEVEERPMRDFIKLESQVKKPPPPRSRSFWNKIQKWRKKQKITKTGRNEDNEKNGLQRSSTSRRLKEIQSEVAIDAFGRRSCDFDRRFSLDVGRRFSLDAGRIFLDEPRVSWDGYLIGSRSIRHRPPSQRMDGRIPVEEDVTIPGGSVQTKDYYFDTSSRSRRRSLDRSNSVKNLDLEAKLASNARFPPAGSSLFFKDWGSKYLGDDRSESFELTSIKKSKRWSKVWSIWGFMHQQIGISKSNSTSSRAGRDIDNVVVEGASSNGHLTNEGISGRNHSVSSRSLIHGDSNGMEIDGMGKKRRDEFVLERNRSARYEPPGHIDNRMLRFDLTPARGGRKGSEKGRYNHDYPSLSRRVLQLHQGQTWLVSGSDE